MALLSGCSLRTGRSGFSGGWLVTDSGSVHGCGLLAFVLGIDVNGEMAAAETDGSSGN